MNKIATVKTTGKETTQMRGANKLLEDGKGMEDLAEKAEYQNLQ